MKRSQMIQEIYDLLNCDGVLEYSMPKAEAIPLTEDHLKRVARWVLETVEENGMQPPLVGEAVETKVLIANQFGWTEQLVENSTVYVSKWENETDP